MKALRSRCDFPALGSESLSLGKSTSLLHGVVQRVSSDVGARVLFIKGPVLTSQGLRELHPSVDVDVLVDPTRVDDLLEALATLGGAVQPPGAFILPLHSTTLRNPRWGCELDVHNRFPGFLADPSDVFEALWERRTTVRIAHQDIPCPSVPSTR